MVYGLRKFPLSNKIFKILLLMSSSFQFSLFGQSDQKTKKLAVIFRQNVIFFFVQKINEQDSWLFSFFATLTKKRKKKNGMNRTEEMMTTPYVLTECTHVEYFFHFFLFFSYLCVKVWSFYRKTRLFWTCWNIFFLLKQDTYYSSKSHIPRGPVHLPQRF